MNDEPNWDELRERIRRIADEAEPGDFRRAHEDAEERIPLEKERIEAFVEATIRDHVDEEHLRKAISHGAIPAIRPAGDRLELYLVHPDSDDLGPLGDFPIEDVMPSQS